MSFVVFVVITVFVYCDEQMFVVKSVGVDTFPGKERTNILDAI